jgi:hydroxypyruvate isomerase
MPKFSGNLSILFGEMPFLDRFAAARQAGFDAVECWFPYEHGAQRVADLLRANELQMVGINSAHGALNEWGIAALPGKEEAFIASVEEALDFAAQCGNCAVHVMAGLAGSIPAAEAWRTYLGNLEVAVRRAEGSDVQLLIEPLNSIDRPGYLLNSVDRASEIIDRTGLQALKIMFDCYHVQVQEGDLVRRLRRHWDKIGHIQVASTPDRSEPGTGEIDYCYIFREIDRLGWAGWVGAEYKPSGATANTFGWMKAGRDEAIPE